MLRRGWQEIIDSRLSLMSSAHRFNFYLDDFVGDASGERHTSTHDNGDRVRGHHRLQDPILYMYKSLSWGP